MIFIGGIMKLLKGAIALILTAALTATSAFAATGFDELYIGSASSVDNDSVYFDNLLDWNKLLFPKLYGLVSLDSEKKGNLAAAINLKNGGQLHAFWNGNLWEDDPENTFSALYGLKNMAFRGKIVQKKQTFFAGTPQEINFNAKGLGADFGMNVNKKFGFTAGLSYLWAKSGGAKLSDFSINGGISYKLKEDTKMSSRVYAGWNGDFVGVDAGPVDVKFNTNTIYGTYKLQYKITKSFTYGFIGNLPITFASGDNISTSTTINFNLYNGFVAKIKPTLDFAAGIKTTLPSLSISDGSSSSGRFRNSFYTGLAIDVTPEVEMAVSANIHPTGDDSSGSNGESLKEIWEQSFAISFSIHL